MCFDVAGVFGVCFKPLKVSVTKSVILIEGSVNMKCSVILLCGAYVRCLISNCIS